MRVVRFLIISTTLILLFISNIWLSNYNWRIDLTEDQRHTLSVQTKNLLTQLDGQDIFIDVFLSGDLPPELLHFQQSISTLTQTLSEEGDVKITLNFLDVDAVKDSLQRTQMIREMASAGVEPQLYTENTANGFRQLTIYPYAIIGTQKRYKTVKLFGMSSMGNSKAQLEEAMQQLEYQFDIAFQSIVNQKSPRIAFIEGNGELNFRHTYDISKAIYDRYGSVDRINIKNDTIDIQQYDLLIMADPTKPFSVIDKYKLDQYIMYGGKVLALIDPVKVSLDSLQMGVYTMAMANELNLTEWLFTYGVRVKPILLLDQKCTYIKINTANSNETPIWTNASWYFSPIIIPPSTNSITKGINPIMGEFMSPIDTIPTQGNIKKEIILTSSNLSILQAVPRLISLEMIKDFPPLSVFKREKVPLAVSLTGNFPSAFSYRSPPISLTRPQKKISEKTKMIIIADGDIIRNELRNTPDGIVPVPLGYNKYSQQTFANKDFLMSCINYLVDNNDLSSLRMRTLKIRYLDAKKVDQNLSYWQSINTLIPILLLITIGLIVWALRHLNLGRRIP